MKRIVTLGGGKGQPELLRHLKQYDVALTAIVSMMDNGGSSGVLRQTYGVLPPGDLRRCIIALAKHEDLLARWWNYRFTQGPLSGHTIGNLCLAGGSTEFGGVEEMLAALQQIVPLRGTVLPVTTQATDLVAVLDSGQRIVGETMIDVPQHDASAHIQTLSLEPSVTATPAVLAALRQADMIVCAMGDLFTSLLPNLLVGGVAQAIADNTAAQVVLICNRSTKPGETHDFTTRDFYDAVARYLQPAHLTAVVVDDGSVPVPAGAQAVAVEALPHDVRTITTNLADSANPARVSGAAAAATIYRLCASS